MVEREPAEFITAMLVLVILWLVLLNIYVYVYFDAQALWEFIGP